MKTGTGVLYIMSVLGTTYRLIALELSLGRFAQSTYLSDNDCTQLISPNKMDSAGY